MFQGTSLGYVAFRRNGWEPERYAGQTGSRNVTPPYSIHPPLTPCLSSAIIDVTLHRKGFHQWLGQLRQHEPERWAGKSSLSRRTIFIVISPSRQPRVPRERAN